MNVMVVCRILRFRTAQPHGGALGSLGSSSTSAPIIRTNLLSRYLLHCAFNIYLIKSHHSHPGASNRTLEPLYITSAQVCPSIKSGLPTVHHRKPNAALLGADGA